jgi:iron complex outermembrane receptor protein
LPITATGRPSTTACRQDTNRFVDNYPEQELWSFYGKGSLALGSNHTASLEYFRTYNEVITNVAPTPLTSLTMPAASPYYPGNGVTPITNPNLVTTAPISLGWRTIAAGPRQQQHENTSQRVLGGLEGNLAGWSYRADAFYSDSVVKQIFTDGYVNRSKILAGLQGNNAPYLNPFGDQSAAGQAYLNSAKILGEVSKAEGTLWGVTATASNEIFTLPAGPVSMAVGLNYLSDELTNTYDFSLIRNAQSSGLELATNTEGDRKVWGAVLELSIPVIKNLDLSLAVRYDDYNDVGSSTNPKVGVRYQALNNLLLRASYNTGFRAPSMFDLYQSPAVTFTANSYDDPVLCPNGVPVAGADANRDCGQQFNRQFGGNPDTNPEESTAFTLGFVFDVLPTLSFGVDYWNQEITGLIGLFPDSAAFANYQANQSKFKRCSQVSAAEAAQLPQCTVASTVDPLAYVATPTDNLGDMKAQGFDLSVQWRGDATEFGRFSVNIAGTYVTKFEQQLEKNGEWYNPLGRYSGELDFPVFRWQSVATVNWLMGPWSASLANRYRSGYRDANEAAVAAPYDDNNVGAYSVWDLVGSWSGVKGLTLSAGVLNLFNEDPPFSNQGSTFQQGFDPRFTNSLGRRWLLRASYEFK